MSAKLNLNHIFKQREESHCTTKPILIEGCQAIKRLITAITYYHKLNVIDNENDREIFRDFIMNIYDGITFVNDYNHLVCDHRNDLEIICKQLENNKNISCSNIKQCQKAMRHNKREFDVYFKSEVDNLFLFYVMTMDSLHFYLFHLYHLGLRVMTPKPEEKDNVKYDEGNLMDYEFSRICQAIKQRGDISNSFDRYRTNKKFDLTATNTGYHVYYIRYNIIYVLHY